MNLILYCRNWAEMVAFYRDTLGFAEHAATTWLVEFAVGPGARVSVADASRTSIRPGKGAGITLTFQVDDAVQMRRALRRKHIQTGPIRNSQLGGHGFFFHDPEGHRLEFWSLPPASHRLPTANRADHAKHTHRAIKPAGRTATRAGRAPTRGTR